MEKLVKAGNKIRSYSMTHAGGFAPNPYGGILTLATCKPGIRRISQVGDWIIGMGSKSLDWNYQNALNKKDKGKKLPVDYTTVNRIIYLMKVKQVVPWKEYYSLFPQKRATTLDPADPRSFGDNIYEYDEENKQYIYHACISHSADCAYTDLNGQNVLVGDPDFSYYLGKNAIEIPPEYYDQVKVLRSQYGKVFKGDGEELLSVILDKIESLGESVLAKKESFPEFYLQHHIEGNKKQDGETISCEELNKQRVVTSMQNINRDEPTIIFSRKGFDSQYGRMPSPIIDKQLISLPIPTSEESKWKYDCLEFESTGGELSYRDLIIELQTKPKTTKNSGENFCIWSAGTKDKIEKLFIGENPNCHFDPQLFDPRSNPDGSVFEASLGQCANAQRELANKGVRKGDLFLFFGNFQMVGYDSNGKMQFITPQKNDEWKGGFHCLWGYLEIGECITNSDQLSGHEYLKKYHPHADWWNDSKNNTIYVAAEKLSRTWYKEDPELVSKELPGYGIFNFSDDLVLTDLTYREKEGEDNKQRITVWDFDGAMKISHKSRRESGSKLRIGDVGQELIVDSNDKNSLAWAKAKLVKALKTKY